MPNKLIKLKLTPQFGIVQYVSKIIKLKLTGASLSVYFLQSRSKSPRKRFAKVGPNGLLSLSVCKLNPTIKAYCDTKIRHWWQTESLWKWHKLNKAYIIRQFRTGHITVHIFPELKLVQVRKFFGSSSVRTQKSTLGFLFLSCALFCHMLGFCMQIVKFLIWKLVSMQYQTPHQKNMSEEPTKPLSDETIEY